MSYVSPLPSHFLPLPPLSPLQTPPPPPPLAPASRPQLSKFLTPIFDTTVDVVVLGFRNGSVIIDYRVDVEENPDNQVLEKRSLEDKLKRAVEFSGETALGLDKDSVYVEGARKGGV